MGSRQNTQGPRQQPRALQMESRGNRDQPPQQQQPYRPRLLPKVRAYALSQKQPKTEQGSNQNGYLAGMGKILDTHVVVLFNTGVSHSFISDLCVDTLNLPVNESEHKMVVSSPVGGTIEISRTSPNVEIFMGDLKLVAHDLQVMTIGDINVVLGIDWLTVNFATIHCKERQISLQTPGKKPIIYYGISMNRRTSIISTLQATTMLRKGRLAYLVYLQGDEKEEREVEDVAVVREYPDVFPEALLGPPPDRQLKFTIDLALRSVPVPKAQCRMAPKELVELRIQLQELIDLGFIRPCVSSWGATVHRKSAGSRKQVQIDRADAIKGNSK
ncbi:uncharacterized protein LOC121749097 [Salvia splendens]|uniref:uncharacterized protein LOC121749097 n=1 Tax=Salvia splendens TaxID=180675 RepID=UPI001C2654E8|nr:uncharacterized protein LOC121749097 [Salvia splendens]